MQVARTICFRPLDSDAGFGGAFEGAGIFS